MIMVIVLVNAIAGRSEMLCVCPSLEDGSKALDAVVTVVVIIDVIGGGIALPLNSIHPFCEQAVPLGQQPPPTTWAHSKVDGGHCGSLDAEGSHSDLVAFELQQNVPDVVREVE